MNVRTLGAIPETRGIRFTVWAPVARSVELEVNGQFFPMKRSPDGMWTGIFSDIQLYRYRIDGDRTLPDPASRYQPQGVHGPSQVIDPNDFAWKDQKWRGIRMQDAVIYELHVGTFTPGGTFAAAKERLPYLQELGITVVELMPLADFPGSRNWGYDGVDLFAPARCYGTPKELREFVDTAHALKLAVLIDVVYNHFGPEGAYAGAFSPFYFSEKHRTPWGPAINFSEQHVRNFFIENALHWLIEYHMDGLRLDATHSIHDESEKHFIAELASVIHSTITDREILLTAEDHRNLRSIVTPDGWGLDASWSDDFHHVMRRLLAGNTDGYFADFHGTTAELATIIQDGWLFKGEYSTYFHEHRGTSAEGLAAQNFIFFLQNHDQVGNRPMGERLNHDIDAAAYRAASVLLLLSPQVPLLFMGQEWAASTAFCYFTDHPKELGEAVTKGRRNEFKKFVGFGETIPDPQALETFEKSKLNWNEVKHEPHAGMLRLYQALLRFRKRATNRVAPTDNGIVLYGSDWCTAVQLRGAGKMELNGTWKPVLTTEDPEFTPDPMPPKIQGSIVEFQRPSAALFSIM